VTDSLARQAGAALRWRAVGLAGSRAIALIRTLILARLLVPDDFGLLAVGVVTIEFLLSLTDFGLRPALVQLPSPTKSQLDSAWTVGLLRALVIAGLVMILAPLIAATFAEPRAVNVIRLLALGPVLNATRSARTTELTRALSFRSLTAIGLTSALVHTAVAIGLASSLGVWALVAGVLAGVLAGSLVSYRVAPYRPHLVIDRAAVAPLYRFGRWIFASGVIAVLAELVLQAVISRRLGTVQLGLYFLAARLAFLPNQVVTDAVSKVAFPVHVRLQEHPERAASAFGKSLTGMWALLVPTYLVLVVLTPALVEELLGPRWIGSTPVIQILALAGIAGVVADATIPLLKGRGHTRGLVLLYAVRSAVILALVWTLAGRFGIVGAAVAWVVAEIAAQLCCFFMVRSLVPRPFEGLASPTLATTAAGVFGALTSVLLQGVLAGPAGVLIAAATGLAAAGLCLYTLDRVFGLGMAGDLVEIYPGVSVLLRRGS